MIIASAEQAAPSRVKHDPPEGKSGLQVRMADIPLINVILTPSAEARANYIESLPLNPDNENTLFFLTQLAEKQRIENITGSMENEGNVPRRQTMRFIHSILFLVLICTCTTQSQEKVDEVSFPELSGPYLGQAPPGLEPKIFAPGIVSSQDRMEHASLTVSPDLNEIYWGSVGKGILFSRIENGRWSTPRLAEFATTDDAEPMFSRDGRRLFFISNRPFEGDPEHGENIWYVKRSVGGWSKPAPLDMTVNGEQLHWQISFAEDGTLYFASRRSGTLGNDDIFISRFVDGHYLRPQNAGDAINSADHETCPFIAYDNSYLLFAALNRADGYGGLDIYISFRREDGSWSKAINIGPPVNTENHETAPYVSPDGKYLFYNSHPSGNGDVYWVSAEIIDRIKTGVLGR